MANHWLVVIGITAPGIYPVFARCLLKLHLSKNIYLVVSIDTAEPTNEHSGCGHMLARYLSPRTSGA